MLQTVDTEQAAETLMVAVATLTEGLHQRASFSDFSKIQIKNALDDLNQIQGILEEENEK